MDDNARMTIRPALQAGWKGMWPIFQSVVATGTTCVFGEETHEDEARPYWFGSGIQSWVAESDGEASHRDAFGARKRAMMSVALSQSRASFSSCLRPARVNR